VENFEHWTDMAATKQTTKTEDQFILLTNSEGVKQQLLQRNVEERHKTLGVYKSLSGSEQDHVAYLNNKSNQITSLITDGQFNQRQAIIAYNTSYILSLMYSLLSVNLSGAKLYTIQNNINYDNLAMNKNIYLILPNCNNTQYCHQCHLCRCWKDWFLHIPF
jgi:hypothetical protein